MKFLKYAFVLGVVFATNIYSQSFLQYTELTDFWYTSPSALKTGLYGFENPAVLNYQHSGFGMQLVASEKYNTFSDFDRWGLFFASKQLGFGALTQKFGDKHITDYRISTGFGDRKFGMGFSYGWSGGDVDFFGRKDNVTFGLLYRPLSQLSLGAHYTKSIGNEDYDLVGEIAVRPIANYPFTIFADIAKQNKIEWGDSFWSAGLSWEFLPGIRVNGRYFNNESFSAGFDLSLGNSGIGAIAQFDNKQEHAFNSYIIRLGGDDRSIIDDFSIVTSYLKINLSGDIAYQRFQWFDNSTTLLDILDLIKTAKESKTINGIVINTSGLNANRSMLWEIRNELELFKKSGKSIVIFIDRANIDLYHFASIADKIVLDPMGGLSLEGYSRGRSYYKKLLAKLDIGYDELRFFKYKSAAESFSNEKMSDGEREQWAKLIEDWYETAKTDVAIARGFSKDKFDELVNGKIAYLSSDALENKLVDTLGRWDRVDEIVKNLKLPNEAKFFVSPGFLFAENKPYDLKWGDDSKNIAVIYALGACAMDDGINARSLIEYVKSACNNDKIKAIVLRVDSPGGDAMASDYIADVVRQFKDKKPIIVSQGYVAASGGYWLSMDAHKIVATPQTITGSIGVISSFMYDKGMKDSLGIDYDVVKKGKYSDLGSSWTLPLLPIFGLPNRPMTADERIQSENSIKVLYKDFVTKVANGRKMTYEKVDEVAQGRIWSGTTGKQIGLVDEIGSLTTAIELAKQSAGIKSEDEVKIYEYPSAKLLDFSRFMPKLIGVDMKQTSNDLKMLEFMLKNNGVPMPVMGLDLLDKFEY